VEQAVLNQVQDGLSNEILLGIVLGLWFSYVIGSKIWNFVQKRTPVLAETKVVTEGTCIGRMESVHSGMKELRNLGKENLVTTRDCVTNLNKLITVLEIMCPIIERSNTNVEIIKTLLAQKD